MHAYLSDRHLFNDLNFIVLLHINILCVIKLAVYLLKIDNVLQFRYINLKTMASQKILTI